MSSIFERSLSRHISISLTRPLFLSPALEAWKLIPYFSHWICPSNPNLLIYDSKSLCTHHHHAKTLPSLFLWIHSSPPRSEVLPALRAAHSHAEVQSLPPPPVQVREVKGWTLMEKLQCWGKSSSTKCRGTALKALHGSKNWASLKQGATRRDSLTEGVRNK